MHKLILDEMSKKTEPACWFVSANTCQQNGIDGHDQIDSVGVRRPGPSPKMTYIFEFKRRRQNGPPFDMTKLELDLRANGLRGLDERKRIGIKHASASLCFTSLMAVI